MKKVVGKSLVLGAIAIGVLSLLGGPNVFSVLSNIKFPSKPQREKPVEKEKEAVIEEKQEKETVATELALEVAKPSEATVVEETVVQKEEEEAVVKPERPLERIEPKPEPEKQRQVQERTTTVRPIEKPIASSSSGYSRRDLQDGVVEITKPTGEAIRYDKNGVRIWSSWRGRLTETKEEKAWRIKYAREKNQGSSGSKGKGVWCLTPRDILNVDNSNECSKMLGWGKY